MEMRVYPLLLAMTMVWSAAMVLKDGALAETVRLEMTTEQVLDILGEPDRRAVLEGKLLRNLTQRDSEIDLSKYRLVFIYETTHLQIWFKEGRVTGMTQNGVAVSGAEGPSRDP